MSDEKKFLRFKPAYDILLLREVVARQPDGKLSWEEVVVARQPDGKLSWEEVVVARRFPLHRNVCVNVYLMFCRSAAPLMANK